MTIFFISLQILTDVMRIKTLNLVTKNWCSNGGSKREWEKVDRQRLKFININVFEPIPSW